MPGPFARRALLLLACAFVLAGCFGQRAKAERQAMAVRDAVCALGVMFNASAQRSAEEMLAREAGDDVRRLALRWQIRIAEMVAKAQARENAFAGLVELWYRAYALAHAAAGSGGEAFAADQAALA